MPRLKFVFKRVLFLPTYISMMRLLTLLTLAFAAPNVFAGQDLNKCQQSSQQAVQSCQAKAQGAEAANASQAAAAGKAATTNINTNANTSKQVNTDAANRLNQAKDGCEKDKKKCEEDCDEAGRSADRKIKQGMSQQPQCSQPPCPEAKADKPQIEPTKQNACIAPIMAMMGKLGDGAGDAQNAANGDGKTGGQSGGMPPIPPIPPPKDDKKDEPPKQPQLTPEQYACSTDPNAATSAKCKDEMVKKCTPGLSSSSAAAAGNDPNCEQFTAHYCNATPSGSTPFPKAIDTTSGQTRAGSGVGTPYCNTAVARNFCQDPARSQCSTCQNYRNQQSEACKADPSSCPTVTTASCPVAEPPIAPPAGVTPTTGKDFMSGGGSGSSGGGEKFTSASVQPASKEGAQSASGSGLHLDMAVSEGGGGGSSGDDSWGSSSVDSFAAKYRKGGSSLNLKAASAEGFRGLASTGPGGVGTETGPSLFGFTTIQIQKLCNRNQLLHCGSLKN